MDGGFLVAFDIESLCAWIPNYRTINVEIKKDLEKL